MSVIISVDYFFGVILSFLKGVKGFIDSPSF